MYGNNFCEKNLEVRHAIKIGINNSYPLGAKLQVNIRAVQGAKIAEDKVAAAPTNAKFSGIRLVCK